jgi:site-specific DNA-cytosine methylase
MTKNMVMKSNENASIIGHSGSGGQKGVIHNVNNKCTCLCATDYAQPKQIICHNLQRRNPDRPSTLKNKNAGGSGHLSKSDGKSYCLDAGQSNAIEINVFDGYNNRMRTDGKCGSITQHCSREGLTNGFKVIVPTNDGKTYCLDAGQSNAIEIVGGVYRTFKDKQGFLPFADEGKCPTLLARARQDGSGQNAVEITTNNKPVIRRLTPIECERLQTIKDNYTDGISDSQRYKCLGNGWTIDIIAHIFSYIK